MIHRTLATALAVAFAALAAPAQAAISVTLERDASGLFDSFEYFQDFDTLASANGSSNVAWSNDATIGGWSLFDSAKVAKTFYRAGNGSDAGGYFYSYGQNGDSDRARLDRKVDRSVPKARADTPLRLACAARRASRQRYRHLRAVRRAA